MTFHITDTLNRKIGSLIINMQISENLVLGMPMKAKDMNQQCAKLKSLEAASHWEGPEYKLWYTKQNRSQKAYKCTLRTTKRKKSWIEEIIDRDHGNEESVLCSEVFGLLVYM